LLLNVLALQLDVKRAVVLAFYCRTVYTLCRCIFGCRCFCWKYRMACSAQR